MAYRRKRKAGLAARRVARKAFRWAIKKRKRAVAKLYAAKVGKSRFKRIAKKVRSYGRKRRRRSYSRRKRRY